MSELTAVSHSQSPPAAAGHQRAVHPYLFGLNRSYYPVGLEGPRTFRAGVVRLRREFGAQPIGDGSRRGNSLALWREATRSAVNVDIPALQEKGLSPVDVINAIELAEPGAAGRHGQNRTDRIQRADERIDRARSQPSMTCRSRRRTERRSTCAMSLASVMASRRRPTSCAWTASAACS